MSDLFSPANIQLRSLKGDCRKQTRRLLYLFLLIYTKMEMKKRTAWLESDLSLVF